jgi:uncharacterized protein DUF1330
LRSRAGTRDGFDEVICGDVRPSREAAQAFYECEEYQPYLRDRLAGSRSEMVLLPGEDVARIAKID